jgi:hypothetical protein
MRSPYAVLNFDGKRATIENLCFLWHCALSPALAALDTGDRVRVWTDGNEIWQVNHDGELLLDYRDALEAHRRAATRQEWVNGAFLAALVAILAWLWWERRGPLARSGPDPSAGSGPRNSGRSSFAASSSLEADLRGPSTDAFVTPSPTRLAGAGLERFREARERRDRDAMVAALVQAGASEAAARMAVDALLAEAETSS